MSYFHGQGGHCNRHFKKAGWSTPVQPDTSREDEATARNLSNRVNSELSDRSNGCNGRTSPDFSSLWYSNPFARYMAYSVYLYWHLHPARFFSQNSV
jgi:hypothetical protein